MRIVPFGQTYLVDGLQLTSATNRESEARMKASTVPESASEAWLYGAGLGDVPRELLKRDSLKKLRVVVMNEEVFRLSGDDWRSDPRVEIMDPAQVTKVGLPCVLSPVEVKQADEKAWHVRDRVLAVWNEAFNQKIFDTMGKSLWDKQAEENARLADSDVSRYFNCDHRSAIVIGGGPTLSGQYDWIRERVNNHQIIAVSTALIPLLANGITPDVVVCIDRHQSQVKHFDGVNCSSLLAYHFQIASEIPRAWQGPRCVIQEGVLFCGGSVIHIAMDLATRRGAKEITLLGADFAYPENKSHVDGCTLPFDASVRGRRMARDGYGNLVRTDDNLAQYRCYAEEFIAAHKDIAWHRRGRGGSEMKHVEWLDD